MFLRDFDSIIIIIWNVIIIDHLDPELSQLLRRNFWCSYIATREKLRTSKSNCTQVYIETIGRSAAFQVHVYIKHMRIVRAINPIEPWVCCFSCSAFQAKWCDCSAIIYNASANVQNNVQTILIVCLCVCKQLRIGCMQCHLRCNICGALFCVNERIYISYFASKISRCESRITRVIKRSMWVCAIWAFYFSPISIAASLHVELKT